MEVVFKLTIEPLAIIKLRDYGYGSKVKWGDLTNDQRESILDEMRNKAKGKIDYEFHSHERIPNELDDLPF